MFKFIPLLILILGGNAHAYHSLEIAYDEPIIYKRYVQVITSVHFGLDLPKTSYLTIVLNNSIANNLVYEGTVFTHEEALSAHNEGIELARFRFAHLQIFIPVGLPRIGSSYLRPSDRNLDFQIFHPPGRDSFQFDDFKAAPPIPSSHYIESRPEFKAEYVDDCNEEGHRRKKLKRP
jgi:hypothetical protein